VALNVFDQLSVGIVLLDRFARVVFANAAARALSLAGTVRLDARVTSPSSPHARRLDSLIQAALGGSSVRTSSPVRTMSLPPVRNGRRPLMVLVSPVQGGDDDRAAVLSIKDAAAMVMLCDPDREAQVPAAWMMDAYGLTMAEVRVAVAASCGTTVAATARRLAISPNTVKTHLRRVFDKTGTCRQAELSRLMATISLAAGRD
jgi:DNA-binding CsgD family transcriptional regulator